MLHVVPINGPNLGTQPARRLTSDASEGTPPLPRGLGPAITHTRRYAAAEIAAPQRVRLPCTQHQWPSSQAAQPAPAHTQWPCSERQTEPGRPHGSTAARRAPAQWPYAPRLPSRAASPAQLHGAPCVAHLQRRFVFPFMHLHVVSVCADVGPTLGHAPRCTCVHHRTACASLVATVETVLAGQCRGQRINHMA